MVIAGLLKKLEIKPTDDEYEAIETNRWGTEISILFLMINVLMASMRSSATRVTLQI
jgi:hypothetical protein